MHKKTLKDVIASESSSIKEVMRLIDHSGLRVAYIVDAQGRLVGAVSDSEIRKAILKGKDVKEPVKGIMNPNPIILREKDLSNYFIVKKEIRRLLSRMGDSRYLLVLDKQDRPKKLSLFSDLLGQEKTYKENHGVKIIRGKRVLVVGGAGYLGSVLVRKLLARGFKVRVLDMLMFGIGSIKELFNNNNFELIEGDMRDISTLTRALIDTDAVINLAAIVGDPACKNAPEAAIETNYLANKILAEACKYHQINRFVFASSCSIYGVMEGDRKLDEESPLNPVSLYARSKIQSEEGILSLMDENFSPTILRMGTLYGYSPRMRFDLVVNTMTKTAIVEGKILVHGGGKQWRPLLHVEDAADAYIRCLEAPISRVRGEIFNVGSDKQNYQILQIAKIVNKCIPKAKIVIEGETTDPRNYFVSFSKIQKVLKFKANHGVERGVLRIKEAIEKKEIKNVNDQRYYNVEYNQ
uniref:NAD-dependent epimerase/dehydratase family protein n=1 Tax=candidate division CPR3 bacterium TaxID=2268181 RepID=A0A7V3J9D8_UNCC3